MSPTAKIALISDLHVGDKAREFDMRPGGKPLFSGQVGFIEYLEKLVQEQGLSADILIVSGDITDRAQPSQFAHAANLIGKIADILSVKSENVVIVPGNHDLNWDVASLAAEKNEPFWLDYRFSPFAMGYVSAGCDATLADGLIKPPHFVHQVHAAADIWSFNSAAYDTPERKPHYGEIREHHREALALALHDRYEGQSKDRLRIFVTHHHLKPQPELYPDIPDFSGMVNGDALLDLVTSHNFDLIFHGHKHRPWIRSTLETGSHPVVTWCSGSFSQTLGSFYEGRIANLWHLVDVHPGDRAMQCRGDIKSWAFAPAQGWVPARPQVHGIDHVTPFGYIQDRPTIIGLVRKGITAAFSDSDYVEWKMVCEGEESLRYQAGPIVWSILTEISKEGECRPHGEKDSLDGLLILKVAK